MIAVLKQICIRKDLLRLELLSVQARKILLQIMTWILSVKSVVVELIILRVDFVKKLKMRLVQVECMIPHWEFLMGCSSSPGCRWRRSESVSA